jgi:nucleoside-diphosphate-sugar epimerase
MLERHCLVTGANGFLGMNLVEQLAKEKWRVTALCQPGTDCQHLGHFPVDLVECDIRDAAAVASAIPRKAEAVFHTAAITSLWSRQRAVQREVNVAGTCNVVDACLQREVRKLIHTSTWNTYGLGHAAICEATPQSGGLSAISYVQTKYLAEEEVRRGVEQGLDAVIINPCHIMGRYDTHNWGRMFKMIAQGRLPGIPPVRGSFCHAEAVALAQLATVDRGRQGENYLLPGVEASFAEVVAVIAELVKRPAPRWQIPIGGFRAIVYAKTALAFLTGKEPDLTPDALALMLNEPRIETEKAERELGYRHVPLRTMLEDTHQWLAGEGLLV